MEQRYSTDDQGRQVEVDPTTQQPTEGQDIIGFGTPLGELADQRPTDFEWIEEVTQWAEDDWTDMQRPI